MLGSFYGGKPGVSFIIVKSYLSIEAMKNDFKQGPLFSEVTFGEYVLINTENKNDPDNGKVFRRGLNYTDTKTAGAIYIGTIVGPAGRAPMLEVTTLDIIKDKQIEEGFEYRKGEGSYTLSGKDLLPGKVDGEDQYNDEIQWGYCSVRNANGEDTTAYIGFKFPYLVVDFKANSVSPYYNRSNDTANFTNNNLVERADDKSHPFYEEWDIKIPKGIKGDSLKNLRVMVADDSVQYENLSKKADDIANSRKVLVYDYYNYDANANGELTPIYLGDYNMIEDIYIDGVTGKITINYTHDDDYGKFLQFVNGISIAENGTVTLSYTGGASDVVLSTKLKWISNVTVNTGTQEGNGTQKIAVTYNDGTSSEIGNPLNYIMRIAVNEENYHLLILYSDPARRQSLISSGQAVTYNGIQGWLDLGSVKDKGGLLVGPRIKISDLGLTSSATTQQIAAALKRLYPNGFSDADKGKVAVIEFDETIKDYYGFDYDSNEWYYIAGSALINIPIVVGKENDADIESKINDLPEGGIWFVID
jgi:hypothetical protein|nr:MAG TPA: hypothetical protein [Caudoviricetes sp.]